MRLKRDGKNVLRPPKSESLFWAFMKHMLGGFSLLLWAGAIMCFVVFAIDVATTEAPQYDNVSRSEQSTNKKRNTHAFV